MQIHEVVEIVFTILLLLFLAMMVIGIMTIITVIEELNSYDVPFTMRVVFITGMSTVYIYLLKMMVSKFTDYHRYL
ncbi:hypothetical protein KBC40_00265 [Patescibacteria group bacterium]|jgi:membrane protein implicated in regulation of membrane protease activity|nr:hypothetical protein [Patescibacteria group bacterium]